MEAAARVDRRAQLFIRAVTHGVLSERDRLLTYTIAEFFNEMSLFIEEEEKKAKAYEDARRGLKK